MYVTNFNADISRLEVGGVIDIKLSDGLSEKEFKKLMARNHLSGGFETIVKNLFVAYQKGLIKRVYLQGNFGITPFTINFSSTSTFSKF